MTTKRHASESGVMRDDREGEKLHTLKLINYWSAASFILDIVEFAVIGYIVHLGLKNYGMLEAILEALTG
jgi:hypothetical protein